MAGVKKAADLSLEELEDQYADVSFHAEASQSQPTRRRIALDTLARYSGSKAKDFQKFVLMSNFPHYVDMFAERMDAEVFHGSALHVAHSKKHKISIIDYRVGAPMAALVVDVLSYISPQCVLMLGLCGGLHHSQKIGDFLLPMAAIRDEGASRHYMPPRVPSLPAFMVQQLLSQTLLSRDQPFKTGVIHTTDYRMWEFDDKFRRRLKEEKASAIDMECSAIFTCGFDRKVPVGALMLISDLPTKPGGIKTQKSAKAVFSQYTENHLSYGIYAMERMQQAVHSDGINLRRFHF